MSADDLHALAHGENLEDVPFAEAIVRHPCCDWGSAFEVFHCYSAGSYQRHWKAGRPEVDFSESEQLLFRVFETIAERATSEGFPTRQFYHNLDLSRRFDSDGNPSSYHPSNWVKWALPERDLKPTKGFRPKPAVELDAGRVFPAFDLWLDRRAQEQ